MSILDIVVLALIILFGLFGLFAGFIQKMSKLFSGIVALGVSFFIASPLNGLLAETSFFKETVIGSWFNGNADLASIISLIVVYIICYIVILVIIRIIFNCFKGLVDKFKVLKVIDRFFGLVFGVVNALFIAAIIMIIIGFIAQNNQGVSDWLASDLDKSFGLASWFYDFSNWAFGEVWKVLDSETVKVVFLLK